MTPDLTRRSFLKLACASPLAAQLAAAAAFVPDRHWRVFVLNDSHLDVGWHALPDVIRTRIAGFIDDAVDLCERSKTQPWPEQYKFTIEHSWVLEYYEQHRTPEQLERLLDCVRRGQIEVGALYTSIHTDLCGHEELVRLTALAGDLRRRFHLPIETAVLNDVSESYTMGLAQVLAKSAVPYFCMGPGAKADTRGIVPHIPRIFRWTAKDGSSVLVAWTPGIWTYARWGAAGYKGDATLADFQKLPDYPYDVMFRHGGKGDISSPDPNMAGLIDGYRKESPEAQIELSTATEFFHALTKTYSAELPAVQGDCADSWADGGISLAHETGVQRRTQAGLIRAEILMTLAGLDFRKSIRSAYNNLQFYSDHTWGLDFDPDNKPGFIHRYTRDIGNGVKKTVVLPPGQTLEAGSPLMKDYEDSWAAKKQYAYSAEKSCAEVMEQSLTKLNQRVAGPGPTIVVWNTLSWARTGLAAFAVPGGNPVKSVRDRHTGRSMPVQRDVWNGVERCTFLAEDVPALGCAVYEVEAGSATETETRQAAELETDAYTVKLDPVSASVGSIFDRRLNRYVNDESADYAIGQYIYADVNNFYEGTGNGGQNKSGYAYGPGIRSVPKADGDPAVVSGPVFSSLAWASKLEGVPGATQLKTRLVLCARLPQVSVQCIATKRATLEKEQIYFAFPFDVGAQPRFSVELAYTVLDWDRDIIPGSWRGYNCGRNFVRVMGADAGVTWSSLDAPLISVGGIHSNEWDPYWNATYVPLKAHIYSYVMSNIWNCNYPLYQGGESRFDYAFLSHDAKFSAEQSFRFGWEMNHPLEARWCEGGSGERTTPFTCHVEPDNVAVTVLKPPERSTGGDPAKEMVLRIFETAGRENTEARIQLPPTLFTSARIVNLVEDDVGPAVFRNGCLELHLSPYELATVRLTR